MAKRPSHRLTIRVAGKTENVPLATLLEVARDTLEILQELDKEISKDDRGTLVWEVTDASLNSPLMLELEPVRRSPIDARERVVDAYVKGLSVLNRRRTKPRHFSTKALSAAKRMAQSYDNGAGKVEFSAPRNAVVLSPKVAPNVEAILSPPVASGLQLFRGPRAEIGTLEGVVTILKSDGQEFFTLKDRFRGCEVRCVFRPELDSVVREAWKRRAQITGAIQYGADGIPRQIEVERIRLLREAAELPQFKDFGIDITGGVDSVEYVRALRDAD